MRILPALAVLAALLGAGCTQPCEPTSTTPRAFIAFPAEPSAWPSDATLRDALAAAGWTLQDPRDANPVATKDAGHGLLLSAENVPAVDGVGAGLRIVAAAGAHHSDEEARALLEEHVEPVVLGLEQRTGEDLAASYEAGTGC